MLPRLLPLIVFAAIGVFLWRGLSLDPGKLPSALIDRPAPEFSVATLSGRQGETDARSQASPIFDSASMAGQVWVLNVWASWCGPCAQEHPQLVALAESRDVPIVGLNYKDAPDDARAWLQRHGDIFDEVLADADGGVGIDWGVYGVPETFVIDAEGRVRHKHVGPVLAEDLEGTLLPLLDSLAAPS